MSMYEPAFAIARYSPSYEKLSALIELLVGHCCQRAYVTRCGLNTYSHAVIVRVHIQSDRSKRFTMESWPPEARYLRGG